MMRACRNSMGSVKMLFMCYTSSYRAAPHQVRIHYGLAQMVQLVSSILKYRYISEKLFTSIGTTSLELRAGLP